MDNYECLWKHHFDKLIERAQKILDTEEYKDGREYKIEADWNAVTKDTLIRVEEGKTAKVPLKIRFTTSDPEDFEDDEDGGHGSCTINADDVAETVIEALIDSAIYELQEFELDLEEPTNITDDITITGEGYIPATYWDPAEGWFETDGAITFDINLTFANCSKLWATYVLATDWVKKYHELNDISTKEIFDSWSMINKIEKCVEKLKDIQRHLSHDECRHLWYKTPDGVEHPFKDAYTDHPEKWSPFNTNYDHINTIKNIIQMDGHIIYKEE